MDKHLELATRLAARTAHDLNNVAAVVSGHIYLLRGAAETPEEAFEAMEKALEHLERMTRSLMAVGTVGAEPVELLDVNDLVRSVTASGSAAGAIELQLGANLPPVSVHGNDLTRALEALVANAREASNPGQLVRVATLSEPDGTLRISVEDQGSGVPSEVRRRDFDPLFSTKGQKGRGIGITLALTVAFLHGGSFDIEDRREGGTRAILRIPLG